MQIQSEIKGCMAVLYLEPLLTLPSLGAIWVPPREEFDMTQRKGSLAVMVYLDEAQPPRVGVQLAS